MTPTHHPSRSLLGKRVAVLAADGFEYVELMIPLKALKGAGAGVDVISLHAGKIRGMNLTEPIGTVRVDVPLVEASVDVYDAPLSPGGLVAPTSCGKASWLVNSSMRSPAAGMMLAKKLAS